MMPCIVQLGGHPDLFSGDTTVLNTLSHLSLVAIGEGSVNVTISVLQGDFDGMADFIRMGLPGPCITLGK